MPSAASAPRKTKAANAVAALVLLSGDAFMGKAEARD
jgi:hypothetical protein